MNLLRKVLPINNEDNTKFFTISILTILVLLLVFLSTTEIETKDLII